MNSDQKKLIIGTIIFCVVLSLIVGGGLAFAYISKISGKEEAVINNYINPEQTSLAASKEETQVKEETEEKITQDTEEEKLSKPKEDTKKDLAEAVQRSQKEHHDQEVPQAAESKQDEIQYLYYNNERYGFSIEYPDIFSDYMLPENGDGIIFSNNEAGVQLTISGSNNVLDDTAEGLFSKEVNTLSNVNYQFQKDNFYVISWCEGETMYYKNVVVGPGSMNTFLISYPSSDEAYYDAIVTHLYETFTTPYIDQCW